MTNTTETPQIETDDRTPVDIHTWFGLSYSNYLVLPRALMQSMPMVWQHQFTAAVDELRAAFAHLQHPAYHVQAGHWAYIDDLTDGDLERLGITRSSADPDGSEESDRAVVYYDRDGEELDQHCASVFVPGTDPVPYYDRGRTVVVRSLRGFCPSGAQDPPEGRRWFRCRRCQGLFVGGLFAKVPVEQEKAAAMEHEGACRG